MYALISIPHYRPARVKWYTEDELLTDADDYQLELNIPDPGCNDAVQDAAHILADDWRGHILVQTAGDIDDVRNYTGHQEHKVRALVTELEANKSNLNPLN